MFQDKYLEEQTTTSLTSTDPDMWYDVEQFQLDHLNEVLQRLNENTLDDEIWGKLIIMEKTKRVAKAYLRKTTVIIDGGDDEFDGQTIGFNYFTNPDRDQQTYELRKKIADGIIIKMDNQGNVKGMARGSAPVIVQNWRHPKKHCIAEKLVRLQGKLTTTKSTDLTDNNDRIFKIFDMKKFKLAIERDPSETEEEVRSLLLKACLRIALVKDGRAEDPMETPCWFMLINLVALDMLKTKLPHIGDLNCLYGELGVPEEIASFKRSAMKEQIETSSKRSSQLYYECPSDEESPKNKAGASRKARRTISSSDDSEESNTETMRYAINKNNRFLKAAYSGSITDSSSGFASGTEKRIGSSKRSLSDLTKSIEDLKLNKDLMKRIQSPGEKVAGTRPRLEKNLFEPPKINNDYHPQQRQINSANAMVASNEGCQLEESSHTTNYDNNNVDFRYKNSGLTNNRKMTISESDEETKEKMEEYSPIQRLDLHPQPRQSITRLQINDSTRSGEEQSSQTPFRQNATNQVSTKSYQKEVVNDLLESNRLPTRSSDPPSTNVSPDQATETPSTTSNRLVISTGDPTFPSSQCPSIQRKKSEDKTSNCRTMETPKPTTISLGTCPNRNQFTTSLQQHQQADSDSQQKPPSVQWKHHHDPERIFMENVQFKDNRRARSHSTHRGLDQPTYPPETSHDPRDSSRKQQPILQTPSTSSKNGLERLLHQARVFTRTTPKFKQQPDMLASSQPRESNSLTFPRQLDATEAWIQRHAVARPPPFVGIPSSPIPSAPPSQFQSIPPYHHQHPPPQHQKPSQHPHQIESIYWSANLPRMTPQLRYLNRQPHPQQNSLHGRTAWEAKEKVGPENVSQAMSLTNLADDHLYSNGNLAFQSAASGPSSHCSKFLPHRRQPTHPEQPIYQSRHPRTHSANPSRKMDFDIYAHPRYLTNTNWDRPKNAIETKMNC